MGFGDVVQGHVALRNRSGVDSDVGDDVARIGHDAHR
jgi:hypothetical protein